MPKLFGKDIAGKMAGALGKHLLVATLISKTPGTRTAGALSAGTTPDSTQASARGIIDDYDSAQIDGTLIQKDDRRVLLLGGTISGGVVPKPGDQVTIENSTYNVIRVARDPAAATYTLQVRR